MLIAVRGTAQVIFPSQRRRRHAGCCYVRGREIFKKNRKAEKRKKEK